MRQRAGRTRAFNLAKDGLGARGDRPLLGRIGRGKPSPDVTRYRPPDTPSWSAALAMAGACKRQPDNASITGKLGYALPIVLCVCNAIVLIGRLLYANV